MKKAQWTMELAAQYNDRADATLRRYANGDPQWVRRLAGTLQRPTAALLKLAYADALGGAVGRTLLARLRTYTPRGGARFFGPEDIGAGGMRAGRVAGASTAKEVRRVQEALRRAIAVQILTFKDDSSPSTWNLPKVQELQLSCIRLGWEANGLGLGPDIRLVKPRWMADVMVTAPLLQDALPWLRFCELCGRLFFKVKHQRFCARKCGGVLYARRRKRKGGPAERRGAKRVAYDAVTLAQHNAWLQHPDQRHTRKRQGQLTARVAMPAGQ